MSSSVSNRGITLAIVVIVGALLVSLWVLWSLNREQEFPTDGELIARFAEIRPELDELNALVRIQRGKHDGPYRVFESKDSRTPQETPEMEAIGAKMHALQIYAADTEFAKNDPCIGYTATYLYGTYIAYAWCDEPPKHIVDGEILEESAKSEASKGYGVYRPLADDWYLTVRR